MPTLIADAIRTSGVVQASPFLWAIENAKIVTVSEGVAPFRPHKFQADLMMDRSPRRLVLKARQTGLSTAIALEALYYALHREYDRTLLVSRNQELAGLLVQYVQVALASMSSPQRLVGESQSKLVFANGSEIVSLPANPATGRGYPASRVYLDEAAFIEHDEIILQGILPTLSNGGQLTALSTPKGRNNLFYRLWSGLDGGPWSRHTVRWQDCPRYTPEWAEVTRASMTRQAWAEEFECDFVASGSAVFDTDDLAACRDGWNPDPDGCAEFVHGWDIGRRRDHTVGISFGRRDETWHAVAFDRVLEPYPVVQNRIDLRHNDYGGRTSVESNGVGDPVIENLTVNVEPYTMTARTKTQAVQALQLLIQQGRLKHGIEQLDRELSLYQWDDTKLVQDCVMASAVAATLALEPVSPLAGAISARMAPTTVPPRPINANLPSVNGRVPTMTQAQRRRSELLDRSTNGRDR